MRRWALRFLLSVEMTRSGSIRRTVSRSKIVGRISNKRNLAFQGAPWRITDFVLTRPTAFKNESNQSGFTLVELMLAVTIIVLVIGSISASLVTATKAMTVGTESLELYQTTRAGMNRIVRDLRASLSPNSMPYEERLQEALEDAAIPPPSLVGSQTGVFIGISTNDYSALLSRTAHGSGSNASAGAGNAASVASGMVLMVSGPISGSTYITSLYSGFLVPVLAHSMYCGRAPRPASDAKLSPLNVLLYSW